MDDIYLGKGDIKYLDKDETKLGAFIELPFDDLTDLMLDKTFSNPDKLETIRIKVLPNKNNDGYTVKILIK